MRVLKTKNCGLFIIPQVVEEIAQISLNKMCQEEPEMICVKYLESYQIINSSNLND